MILRESETNPAIAWPLADFGAHLRLAHGFADDGSEDPIMTTCLRNAMALVERQTGQALLRRNFELKVSRWDREGHLTLPVGPVETLSAFRLISGAAAIEVRASAWQLSSGTVRQVVSGAGGAGLPDIPTGYWAELEFEAGHADDWSGVPGDLQQAVLMTAAHFYEFRGGQGRGLPDEVTAILDARRPVRI